MVTRFARRGCLAVLLLIAPGVVALQAHDFWLEPSDFRPGAGALVRLALRVGHAWDGDPVRRASSRIDRFVVVSDDGQQPVLGQDGGHPAGLLRPTSAGVQVVGYRSLRVPHQMEGPAFDQYLVEEGLESIRQQRAKAGTQATAAREVYSRCAKALLAVGDASRGGHDRRLGFTVELVPAVNPYTHRRPAPFPVDVLYEGQPLAGVLVVAVSQQAPQKTLSQRSNERGRVNLALDAPGPWLIKAVHMVPAPAGLDADWESFWASLTFSVD